MELRLAEIELTSTTQTRAAFRVPRSMVRPTFAFITYAVEIEGEAPLIAFAESVDD